MHHQMSGEGVSVVYIRKLSWPATKEYEGSLSPPSKRMWISQSDCQTRKEISDIRIPFLRLKASPGVKHFKKEI